MSKWVKLASLKPVQAFVTAEGRLGELLMLRDDHPAEIRWSGQYHIQPFAREALIFPLDPTTLASDLEELDWLRAMLADERKLQAGLIRQAKAEEREWVVEYALGSGWIASPLAARRLAESIRSLGPPPEPEALHEAQAERDRLRAALREIVALSAHPETPWVTIGVRAVRIAREALEGRP